MKPFIPLYFLFSFLFVGCTRSAPDTSRITFKTPAFSVLSKIAPAQSMSVGALSDNSKWGLAPAVSATQITCYALLVQAPDLPNDLACNTALVDGNNMYSIEGVFGPNETKSIEVPSGIQRTIYLVGFATTDSSLCVSLGQNGGVLPAEKFSPPAMLGKVTKDLWPGEVTIDIPVAEDITGSFEDCDPKSFATNKVQAEFDSATLPTIVTSADVTLDVDVKGFRVDKYSYKIVQGPSCAGAVDDQAAVFSSQNITADVSGFNDGYLSLCVWAKYTDEVVQSVPTRHTFYKDASAPVLASVTPKFGPLGTATSTTITITGGVAGDTVELFKDATCTTTAGTGTIGAGGSVDLPTGLLSEGANTLAVKMRDSLLNETACSSALSVPLTASYMVDTTRPTMISNLTPANSYSLHFSPMFRFDAATDTGGSGVDRYKINIGSVDGGNDILADYILPGSATSFYVPFVFPLTDGWRYYISVLTYDKIGLVSASAFSASWDVNTTATWNLQAYGKAFNSNTGDNFGHRIAVDGDIMVVGAPYEDSGNADFAPTPVSDSGAVYVYERTGASWTQVAFLKAPAPGLNDHFGKSVAIDGKVIVVGAPGESSSSNTIVNGVSGDDPSDSGFKVGAAYVYELEGASWTQKAYLKAPNARAVDSLFGYSVAVEGDLIVVGAPHENGNQTLRATPTTSVGSTKSGAAYVFKRGTTNWAHSFYLKSKSYDIAQDEEFGYAVAIHNGKIAVGAPRNDSAARAVLNSTGNLGSYTSTDSGAAYIFDQNPNGWYQMAAIKASNADPGDNFGASVSLFNDTLVVGAPQEESLADGVTDGTLPLAIPVEEGPGSTVGAVYVYDFKAFPDYWTETAQLKSSNAFDDDAFGWDVSIDGSTIAVGANGQGFCDANDRYSIINSDPLSCVGSGAVFTFARNSSGNWLQKAFLKADNNVLGQQSAFGTAVKLEDETLYVGAPYDNSTQSVFSGTADTDTNKAGAGAVFIYKP